MSEDAEVPIMAKGMGDKIYLFSVLKNHFCSLDAVENHYLILEGCRRFLDIVTMIVVQSCDSFKSRKTKLALDFLTSLYL